MKKILVCNNVIAVVADNIELGYWGEEQDNQRYKIEDSQGNLLGYAVNAFSLYNIESVPDDFEAGKYLYQNGVIVQNPQYRQYTPIEERLNALEESDVMHTETETELLYELTLSQFGA